MKKFFTNLALIAAVCSPLSAQTIFDTPEIQYMVLSIEPATVQTYQDLDWMGMSGWYNYGHAKGDVIVPETVEYGGRAYTVVRIGAESFYWHEFMTSIEIPATVTLIGEDAFRGMNRSILKSVNIKGCQIIEKNAFIGNIALEEVTMPANLVSIGESAFQNCTLLETIEIPAGVTEIAPLAFSGCTYLYEVYNYATVPQMISGVTDDFDYETNPVFKSVNVKKIDLYVPKGCKEAYEAAEVWKDFRIFEMEEGAGVEKLYTADAKADIYDLMGRLVMKNVDDVDACGLKGVYMVRRGNISKKVIF